MINFKIPVNRHLFAGQLKTECLKETSSASAALWYDYHQTRKKKKKNDFHSLEKWVTLTLQIGVTSHAHAYTWNQIAVKSSHWGQSTALEAHIQRAFTVHACTAIHRDTNYNEQIWSGVGSCPSKLAHHTKKTHAHFKLKRTLAASHAGRARWRHVLRVKCNANDKLGATPTDFTAHRTRTCEPSHDALANKAHLSA